MRHIFFISSLFAVFFFLPTESNAQTESGVAEINFEVSGVCKMCKKRIENAALTKGVKFAQWDKNTQMIKVIFKPSKITPLDIHNAIANAGYDTSLVEAPDEAYKELPSCCRYKDGIEVH
ncbi:MAG: heavy-metal-associated domain-containing protein [Saprospiraceae bacterium]|nr:heavy-metal-associated domain-containing protein [Saprospiraceae bacterium]